MTVRDRTKNNQPQMVPYPTCMISPASVFSYCQEASCCKLRSIIPSISDFNWPQHNFLKAKCTWYVFCIHNIDWLHNVSACSMRKPITLPRPFMVRTAPWPKVTGELGNVYLRRERAPDRTGKRFVFVVCSTGTFKGCVYDVKS